MGIAAAAEITGSPSCRSPLLTGWCALRRSSSSPVSAPAGILEALSEPRGSVPRHDRGPSGAAEMCHRAGVQAVLQCLHSRERVSLCSAPPRRPLACLVWCFLSACLPTCLQMGSPPASRRAPSPKSSRMPRYPSPLSYPTTSIRPLSQPLTMLLQLYHVGCRGACLQRLQQRVPAAPEGIR